jgi:hypothetical protein
MINHDGGSSSSNIILPENLLKGFYTIQLKTAKKLYSQLLIVQ